MRLIITEEKKHKDFSTIIDLITEDTGKAKIDMYFGDSVCGAEFNL
jgi:hypothetical protein